VWSREELELSEEELRDLRGDGVWSREELELSEEEYLDLRRGCVGTLMVLAGASIDAAGHTSLSGCGNSCNCHRSDKYRRA
jgi:hypothetical protein